MQDWKMMAKSAILENGGRKCRAGKCRTVQLQFFATVLLSRQKLNSSLYFVCVSVDELMRDTLADTSRHRSANGAKCRGLLSTVSAMSII